MGAELRSALASAMLLLADQVRAVQLAWLACVTSDPKEQMGTSCMQAQQTHVFVLPGCG